MYKIKLDIYDVDIKIIVAKNKEWRDNIKLEALFEELELPVENFTYWKTIYCTTSPETYIYLYDFDLAILAHEIVHVYHHLKDFLWIDDEETEAYIQSYVLAEFIQAAWKKKINKCMNWYFKNNKPEEDEKDWQTS